MSKQMTMTEVVESMTGFEEIELDERFGHDVSWLLEHRSLLATRALAFVLAWREAGSAQEGYDRVMGAPMKELKAFFVDAAEGDDPEADADPEFRDAGSPELTETGKGDSEPASAPTS